MHTATRSAIAGGVVILAAAGVGGSLRLHEDLHARASAKGDDRTYRVDVGLMVAVPFLACAFVGPRALFALPEMSGRARLATGAVLAIAAPAAAAAAYAGVDALDLDKP